VGSGGGPVGSGSGPVVIQWGLMVVQWGPVRSDVVRWWSGDGSVRSGGGLVGSSGVR
jgi:hypothetical protein